MDVIIVCHTEFGIVKNGKVVATKDSSTVEVAARNLMTIASTYKAKITFALCPEIVDYFPKEIDHEIGLHIHPGWQEFESEGIKFHVGDRYLRERCRQSSDSTVLRDYSFAEQYLMIKEGIERLILSGHGVPLCFVAGRWSINNDTVKALIRNALLRDCSAAAHQKAAHFDWSKLPKVAMPYHPSLDDYQKEGDSDLLIIPISQMIRGGNFNPEMAGTYGEKWLEWCFFEHSRRKAPLLHICLHSPCMADDYYYGVMDKFLRFLSRQDVTFKFVSEVALAKA